MERKTGSRMIPDRNTNTYKAPERSVKNDVRTLCKRTFLLLHVIMKKINNQYTSLQIAIQPIVRCETNY